MKIESLQSILHNFHKKSKLKLGTKVYAIGFGKYPYLNFNFAITDMLLPTITYGIVSKVISFDNK